MEARDDRNVWFETDLRRAIQAESGRGVIRGRVAP